MLLAEDMDSKGSSSVRKSLFCNGKKMRCLCCSLLASIDLYHARHIERVDPRKGIRSDEYDTTVRVYFLLCIAQPDGL